MKVSVTFTLPASVKKQGKWYVARCLVLDVVTQGVTKDKAKANLADALYLFLVSCLQRGTLDTVLKQCGFTLGTTRIRPPKNGEYVEVPIPFAASGRSAACHA